MLYEVRIVEPEGHAPKRFELTRESPLQQGDIFMLSDLFFVVRRVRAAREGVRRRGGAADGRAGGRKLYGDYATLASGQASRAG